MVYWFIGLFGKFDTSLAALRLEAFLRLLNYLGSLVIAAGIATIVAALKCSAILFGLGSYC